MPLIKELIEDKSVFVTTGTTYDNKANLAEAFYSQIIKRYEGTRLGRQELLAEILDDNPNALFTREDIDNARVIDKEKVPELMRIHVGVDPAVTSGDDSSDTGIVVAGQDENDHYWVIADYTCHKKPMGWATQVMKAFCWNEADLVIGEVNNGGDLIEAVIRQVPQDDDIGVDLSGEDVPYKCVRATRGKAVRAEPVGALCEQGRLHMVGSFPELEDQLVQYDPESTEISPDRYDALVWAVISIMKEPQPRITTL
jgi:phage terminase large subunit-like protein